MEKLLEATSAQTVRSRSLSGKPLRQLETDWTQQWEGPDSPGPLPMPLQVLLTEEARTRIERSALAGNPKARALLPHTVGQVVGIMNSVRPAARVLQEMIEEYLEVAERFAAAVEGA
jgi:NAD(P)H-dependent flavin oxidoreductase YrpB (nitropropane dioxygenase family)